MASLKDVGLFSGRSDPGPTELFFKAIAERLRECEATVPVVLVGLTSVRHLVLAATILGWKSNRFGLSGSIVALTQWVLRAPNARPATFHSCRQTVRRSLLRCARANELNELALRIRPRIMRADLISSRLPSP